MTGSAGVGADRSRISSARSYRFSAGPEEVWSRLGRVGDYTRWWPWLRRFDAVGLVPGDVWRCTIRPPLPYVLRVLVHVEHVAQPSLVVARVSGDIAGRCRVELHDHPEGTEVRVTSELTAERGLVTRVSRALPSLARWGHDWVLDAGARQFARTLSARPSVTARVYSGLWQTASTLLPSGSRTKAP
ncbi:MAG TPA: SRPBCC family protein [Acidimicrobiales bacterium]|nr:SRPBCC family protein [Acidimicrobiales bacterium]